MFRGVSETTTKKGANEAACEFICKKRGEMVKGPIKVQKLTARDPYARRLLRDGGYYKQLNRENVSTVDLKDTPIVGVTPQGIKTSGGIVHEPGIIILAAGLEAIEGSYAMLDIKGRKEVSLKDY